MGSGSGQGYEAFERAANEFQSVVNTCAMAGAWEASLRSRYQATIRAAVDKVKRRVAASELTWQQGAEQLNQLRNDCMEMIRARSTPMGRALAQSLK
jgi:hypothetical protein